MSEFENISERETPVHSERPKGNAYLIPIAMAAFMAFGLYLGNVLTPQREVVASSGQVPYRKIQDVIDILDHRYVDPVDGEALFEKTIGDMLHSLDPHSNYISGKDLLAMNEQIEGNFGGVGVRFFIIRDTLCITNVLPNSPSERVGLKSGDKIIEIDGEKVASKKITNDKVMSMLKGLAGTDVKLKVLRDGKEIDKTVTRGGIPIQSVVAAYMIDNATGYIRINSFSKTTSTEFKQAADRLVSEGMKKVILDVRSNGGGVLTGATEIADEFLESGLTIVETRGEHMTDYRYRSTSKGNLKNVEVAVLINESSASASEILAGAIQDNDRGVIIGRRSFGKGLVQEDLPLRDGSNIRLTIARYYTPTGRCIQKPYSDDFEDYYKDHMARYDNGELYAVDSTLFVDSLKYTTPGGKTVYGGGGIMPEIFVPYDSSGSSWYFTELRFSSVFTTFAFDYVNGKRNKWSSLKEFNRTFRVTDNLLKRFSRFAKEEYGIREDQKGLERSKKLISKILKGEIARQLWVEQGYYQVINTTDKEVQTAWEELK